MHLLILHFGNVKCMLAINKSAPTQIILMVSHLQSSYLVAIINQNVNLYQVEIANITTEIRIL